MNRLQKQLTIIMRGVRRLGIVLWNLLLIPSPFAPIMLFYHIAPVLLVHLYNASPSTQASIERIAAVTGTPWWFIPGMFLLCAMIGYEVRSPPIHALLILPMAFYAFVILVLALTGRTPSGLITALYMTVASWSALAQVRYYQELQTAKRAIAALQKEVSKLHESDRNQRSNPDADASANATG